MTLIEYRSGLISLLSLDARRAFTGPYSDDCRRHFSSAPRSHLLNTVVARTRPQTERATDSAICSVGAGAFGVPERAAPSSGDVSPNGGADMTAPDQIAVALTAYSSPTATLVLPCGSSKPTGSCLRRPLLREDHGCD